MKIKGIGLKSILVTGGARSGKSRFAQELALKSGKPVLFVATAEAGDEEMKQRIRAHQRSRPPGWGTLEITTGVGNAVLKEAGGVQLIIVDCITMLVNNVFNRHADRSLEQIDTTLVEKEVTREIAELIECLKQVNAEFIIVTNEIGLGLVPANPIDRLYRDLLGKANRLLAEQVDEVYLMVAGLPVLIKPGV